MTVKIFKTYVFNEQLKVKTHTHLQSIITAKQNGHLPIGVGKFTDMVR